MDTVTAATWIAAGVLLVAGWSKVVAPEATGRALALAGLPDGRSVVRLLGASEVLVGALVLVHGGAVFNAAQAALYTGFAVYATRQLSRPAASCGCFGQEDAPLTRMHVAVDAALAGASATAAITAAPGLVAGGVRPEAILAGLLVMAGVGAVRSLLVDVPVLVDAMRR